jgi:hypothetical protein
VGHEHARDRAHNTDEPAAVLRLALRVEVVAARHSRGFAVERDDTEGQHALCEGFATDGGAHDGVQVATQCSRREPAKYLAHRRVGQSPPDAEPSTHRCAEPVCQLLELGQALATGAQPHEHGVKQRRELPAPPAAGARVVERIEARFVQAFAEHAGDAAA